MSDRLIVQATVDETDIGRVSRGQRAELTLDAYPTHVITGKVDEIAYEAKTVNNVTVYTVDVLPDTVPAFLRSGMTANLKIVVAQTHQALLLPTDAITMEGSAATVKVANPSDPAAPKTVTIVTGLSDNRKVEIVSGLQEGDSVLIPVKSLGLPRNRQGKSNSTNPFSPFGRPKK